MNTFHPIYNWKPFLGIFFSESFSFSFGDTNANLLFSHLCRILVDAAQTPTIKTKIAELKFLTNLATTYCRSEDFQKQPPTSKAILKIVQLANDQKSVELRSQARGCLIALYNCNTPDVSMHTSTATASMVLEILAEFHCFLISPTDDCHFEWIAENVQRFSENNYPTAFATQYIRHK